MLGDEQGASPACGCATCARGALSTLEVGALFVAIGHKPNTDLFRGVLDMNAPGYLVVQPGSTRTNDRGRVRLRRRDGSRTIARR